MITAEQIHAGQAVYTKFTLSFYDRFVLDFTSNLIWRCSPRRLLAHYREHLSANHLEVGVGTGYMLEHSRFPAVSPRLALLDLNPHCLEHTSRRLRRYCPERYQANVLAPLNIPAAPFDSIGMNFVVHCLPGALSEKALAFRYLGRLLSPGGLFFGSTLLHEGVPLSQPAAGFMRLYNRLGIFSNTHDSLTGLQQALAQHFSEWRVEVVGCVALFSARMPLAV